MLLFVKAKGRTSAVNERESLAGSNVSAMTAIPAPSFDVFSVGLPRTRGSYLKAHH